MSSTAKAAINNDRAACRNERNLYHETHLGDVVSDAENGGGADSAKQKVYEVR